MALISTPTKPAGNTVKNLSQFAVKNGLSEEHKVDNIQPDSKYFTPDENESLKNDTHSVWDAYLSNEATIPVFDEERLPLIQAEQVIQREAQMEQQEIDYLNSEVLEQMQNIKIPEAGLDAQGSLNFNNLESSTFNESDSTIKQPDVIAEPVINNLAEISTEPTNVVEDSHTLEPQPFKNENLDVVRHHDLVDFPYFFGTVGEAASGVGNFITKNILNTRNFMDVKSALGDLFIHHFLGLGEKKPLTKEEQEEQRTQNTNKSNFFASLRQNIMSADRRRALKERIFSINKQTGRSNLSYEGILDQTTGDIRVDVQQEAEKANSQKTEEQLKEEKRRKFMSAARGKTKTGPGITTSVDKSHNFNNAAKLAG